jgi:hypothetical protein
MANFQGSDPGGGKRDSLQEAKSSESVRAAGRPGPAFPVNPTLCTQIWQRDSICVLIYNLNFPSCRKIFDFDTQVWAIAVVCQKCSFLLITFTHGRVGAGRAVGGRGTHA